MTRAVSFAQTFWLAGYYDDFNHARSVADDGNTDLARDHDHILTHYGSILSGDSTLNPRYRYSIVDRVRDTSGVDVVRVDDPLRTVQSHFRTTDDDKLTINRGIHEWLTYNEIMGNPDGIEGRSRLRVPSSLSPNSTAGRTGGRGKFNRFINGHDTGGSYYAPIGSAMEPGHYGAVQLSYNDDLTNNVYAGGYASFVQENTPTSLKQVSTNFAYAYMGEKKDPDLTAVVNPDMLTHNVKSPSGGMFLVSSTHIPSSVSANTATRILNYTGPLRLRGVGEMFHMRLTAHHFAGAFDKFQLKIGYKGSATYTESSDDFSDTACIATVDITPANLNLPADLDAFTTSPGAIHVPNPYDETQVWADVFVYFDFAGGNWSAYANDATSAFATGSINAAVDRDTAAGWSLDIYHSGYASDLFFGIDVLIDRAAVMLPLNWKLDGTVPPGVKDFRMNMRKSAVGTCSVTIMDDDNDYSLSALVTGTSATEWRLLAFRDQESRPIWSGIVDSVSHRQSSVSRTLETTILARDSSSILDRILPIWDRGQVGTAAINEHIALDYAIAARASSARNLNDILNFGSRALTVGDSDVGYSSYNESASGTAYSHNDGSRSHIYSGTAVQIYNNEDSFGPNNAEDYWFGRAGTTYSLSRIHAIRNQAGKRSIYVERDGTAHTFSGTNNEDSTITTYLGLAVGDSLTLSGTGYDGTYVIASFSAHRNENDEQFVEIEVTDSGAAAANDFLFEVERILTNDMQYGYTWLELLTSANHGMNVGETFIMPRGCGTTADNRDYLKLVPLTVLETPDATRMIVKVPTGHDTRLDDRTFVQTFTSGTSYTGTAYDLTAVNSHNAHRMPLVKPICFEGSISADTVYTNTRMRSAHGRWVRDLPLSPWFKARFGVIKDEPHWRSGAGSNLQHPLSPQHISTLGLGGYATGGKAPWTGIKTSLTTSSTTIVFEEPGMAWAFKQTGEDYAIIELLDNETNDMQVVIASDIAYPSTSDSLTFDEATGYFTPSSFSASTYKVGVVVIHEGFDDARLNGPMRISEISGSTYAAERVIQFEAGLDEFAYMRTRYLTGSAWNYGAAHHFRDPDCIRARVDDSSRDLRGTFTDTVNTAGTVYYGEVTATGVKGLRRAWDKDSTIYSLRNVDESNGYKHLFVLWSDMRNDQTADADGGKRKNDFGLLVPTTQNYTVNVTFADQLNEEGTPDVFTELKIGEDVDLWNFDSENEPYSGAAWCAQNGGTNDEPSLFALLKDWDEKAGSFVLVDASRFFNLNTMATNGRVGYASGGLVDFGDYVLSVKGSPYLVDSYYRSSVTSWKNLKSTDKTTKFIEHPNARYMINDHTRLLRDVSLSDTTIYVDDNSLFDTSGYGAIVAQRGDNRQAEDLIYYYAWTGKGTDTIGDKLTGVYITSLPNVADPATAETLIKAEVTAGGSGSRAEFDLIDPLATTQTGDYTKVLVYNTTAAVFALRLMLNIEGRVLSENGGTYYGSDKMRSLFSLMTANTWATTTALPCIYDLSTVPQMKDMQNPDKSSLAKDDFGSVHEATGQTILQIVQSVAQKDGSGKSTERTNFNWLIGPDNLLSIRGTYSTQQALTRSDVTVSDMTTSLGTSITNVRVLFNGNMSHVDFPEPTVGGTSPVRFRVLEHPNIINRDEALAIAKQSFNAEQQSRIRLSAQILRRASDTNSMLTGARHGYVGDVFRRGYWKDAADKAYNANNLWNSIFCGFPFSGVQDILDNNVDTFTEPAYTTTGLRAYALPEAGGVNLLTLGLKTGTANVGTSASSIGKTGKLNFNTSSGTISVQYDALNGGSSYSAGQTVVAGWNTVADGGNSISFYIGGSFLSQTINQAFDVEYTMAFTRIEQAHHFGTQSLSNAIRVVAVERDCPKTNAAGDELRIAITIEDAGASVDAATFKLWLLDYSFSKTPAVVDTTPAYNAASLSGSNSVTVAGSGFHTLAVPSSYSSSQEKVTFSVDCEYLRAILRKTTGDRKNAHNLSGLSTYSSFNTSSAFPLGQRQHTKTSITAHATTRGPWFSPRLHIVDDIAFRPATTLTYTDTHVDLSAETMVIEDVSWSQTAQDVEKVNLTMQRRGGHYSYTLAGALGSGNLTPPSDGARPGSPPGSSPFPPQRQPSGNGGSVAPQGIPEGGVRGGDTGFTRGGFNANYLTNGVIRGLNGRSSFSADNAVSSGDWGVIGQRKPATALAADRDVDGIESSFAASEGAAIQTSDGISLAGVADPEVGAQGETNSYTTNVRVPSDVSETATLSITGIVTLDEITGGGPAVITTTATCVETGASISQDLSIAQGSTRASKILMMARNLDGANTPGNTIKVEVSRSPGQGSDSATYQTLTIHTLSVALRRFSINANAQSNRMVPY